MRLLLACSCLSLLAAGCAATPAPEVAAPRPNVVLIFCDDLGYGDLGCFGSELHRTPNIDRLAAEGLRMTSFYVTSGVCTPSRSSLMTGCYPRRVNLHVDAKSGWVLFPMARKGLNPDEVTIAEVLKGRGYATACVGKWHLGDQPPFLPRRQGFDSYFGIPYSNDMGTRGNTQRPPLPLMRNETVIEAPADQETLTSRYTEESIRFIRANKDRPFFLYLPHTFPHDPHHASDAFRGKSANGLYGDCIEEIDASTGRILATLKEVGVDERTLVIFLSDNGAQRGGRGSNVPLRGFKGSTWEGGMRVPFIARWPGEIPAGFSNDELATSMDLMPTLARLAGGSEPTDRKIDGRDIWPLLSGAPGARSPHEAFYYYHMGHLQAVRDGRWKLSIARQRRDQVFPLRLYDLEADIAEQTNVASHYPDVVARLEGFLEKARADLGDLERVGGGQRAAALVPDAKPLLKKSTGE